MISFAKKEKEDFMKKVKILCIGDSHTAGYPDYDPVFGGSKESTYQFWLKGELKKQLTGIDFELINYGICGDSSRGVTSRLINSLKAARPDMVILQGGTNDLNLLTDLDIFDNLKKGYDECIIGQIPVIAVSIPPVSLQGYRTAVLGLNRRIEKYSSENPMICFSDWFSALKDSQNNISSEYDCGDGVHLSAEGYKRVGKELFLAVMAILKGIGL